MTAWQHNDAIALSGLEVQLPTMAIHCIPAAVKSDTALVADALCRLDADMVLQLTHQHVEEWSR